MLRNVVWVNDTRTPGKAGASREQRHSSIAHGHSRPAEGMQLPGCLGISRGRASEPKASASAAARGPSDLANVQHAPRGCERRSERPQLSQRACPQELLAWPRSRAARVNADECRTENALCKNPAQTSPPCASSQRARQDSGRDRVLGSACWASCTANHRLPRLSNPLGACITFGRPRGGRAYRKMRAELTTITRILLRRRCICEGGLWQELLVSHPAVRFSSAASVFSVPPPKLGSCSRDLMRLKMPHYFARTSIQTTLPPSSRQLAQSERRQRTCSDELLECKDHTCSTCSMVPFIGHPRTTLT